MTIPDVVFSNDMSHSVSEYCVRSTFLDRLECNGEQKRNRD
jgi:hypothetical protein